jgi:hypothetical protein
MKKIFFIISCFLVFCSCEKDDICDSSTPTTPRIVIEFYNFQTPTLLKAVTNLKIIADGTTTPITFTQATDDSRFWFNGTKISIPLKIDVNSTKYNFILDANNLVNSKTDVVQFNYSRNTEYVSRACGFRTFFTFDPLGTTPVTVNGNASTPGTWIKNVQIIKTIIADEITTHIRIFI